MTDQPPSGSKPQDHRLLPFLLAYGLLVLAGSLYPFSGWQLPQGPVFQFLTAPWPRYFTRTDLATNLFTYTPLGYAFTLWFSLPRHRMRGVAFGVMAGTLLSFVCEALQQLLPGRIASNLDLAVNMLGALLGALIAIHHGRWIRAFRAMARWRYRWFWDGRVTDLGLVLLGLWLVAQFALVPVTGIGWLQLHLRPLDTPPESLARLNVGWFFAVFMEAAVLGAFAGCLLRPGRYVGGLTLLLFAAFFSKLLVATILLKLSVVGGVLSMETLTALLLAFWLLLLPQVSRHRVLFAMGGMVTLTLVRFLLSKDFVPVASLLNIVGLAKHIGAIWPILGFAWLLWGRTRGSGATPAPYPKETVPRG